MRDTMCPVRVSAVALSIASACGQKASLLPLPLPLAPWPPAPANCSDKVAHEHIYWDQASVLVQVGLLQPAGLPVAGVDTARKVLDNTQPSNTLMAKWASSAGKPV